MFQFDGPTAIQSVYAENGEKISVNSFKYLLKVGKMTKFLFVDTIMHWGTALRHLYGCVMVSFWLRPQPRSLVKLQCVKCHQ